MSSVGEVACDGDGQSVVAACGTGISVLRFVGVGGDSSDRENAVFGVDSTRGNHFGLGKGLSPRIEWAGVGWVFVCATFFIATWEDFGVLFGVNPIETGALGGVDFENDDRCLASIAFNHGMGGNSSNCNSFDLVELVAVAAVVFGVDVTTVDEIDLVSGDGYLLVFEKLLSTVFGFVLEPTFLNAFAHFSFLVESEPISCD